MEIKPTYPRVPTLMAIFCHLTGAEFLRSPVSDPSTADTKLVLIK